MRGSKAIVMLGTLLAAVVVAPSAVRAGTEVPAPAAATSSTAYGDQLMRLREQMAAMWVAADAKPDAEVEIVEVEIHALAEPDAAIAHETAVAETESDIAAAVESAPLVAHVPEAALNAAPDAAPASAPAPESASRPVVSLADSRSAADAAVQPSGPASPPPSSSSSPASPRSGPMTLRPNLLDITVEAAPVAPSAAASSVAATLAQVARSLQADDLDGARIGLDQLASQLPARSLTLLRHQAWYALRAGDLNQAGELYTQVLARVPNDHNAALNLAMIEAQRGQLDAAKTRVRGLQVTGASSHDIARMTDLLDRWTETIALAASQGAQP